MRVPNQVVSLGGPFPRLDAIRPEPSSLEPTDQLLGLIAGNVRHAAAKHPRRFRDFLNDLSGRPAAQDSARDLLLQACAVVSNRVGDEFGVPLREGRESSDYSGIFVDEVSPSLA